MLLEALKVEIDFFFKAKRVEFRKCGNAARRRSSVTSARAKDATLVTASSGTVGRRVTSAR